MADRRKPRRRRGQRYYLTKSLSTEREGTAIHEAAHAVVAVRLGLPLASTDVRLRRVTHDGDEAKGELGVNLKPGQGVLSSGYTAVELGTVAASWPMGNETPAKIDHA